MSKSFGKQLPIPQIVLFIVAAAWFIYLLFSPVAIHPDSGGYQMDADHLFQHDYSSYRPPLFPMFLRISDLLHLKLSVTAFLFNAASLVYLAWISGRRESLFTRENALFLLAFFLLPAFWSFSGAKLSESILLGVVTWIFIFMLGLYFPMKPATVVNKIALALGVSILSILLKPWIMVGTFLIIGLLLVASFVFAAFRNTRSTTLLLLVVAVICYGISFKYNMRKSPTAANMVLLLCETGSQDLKERLAGENDTTGERAVLLRNTIADIDYVNEECHRDPFSARQERFKVLRFMDPDHQAVIKKVFLLTYFKRPIDVLHLIRMDLSIYFTRIWLGWGCFQNNGEVYGPSEPWFRTVSAIGMLLLVGSVIYSARAWRKANPGKRASPAVTIFFWCVFLAGLIYALFLCVVGGIEQARTVLPAALLQLLALTWYIRVYRLSAAGRI